MSSLQEYLGKREEFINKTIPLIALEHVNKQPEKAVFRYKHLGIYCEVTWRELFEHAKNFCLGLAELGLQRGDRIGFMGEPRAEWYFTDLAILSAGAISFGIYTTSSIEQVYYEMDKTAAKFIIVEDQEYVDKILPSVNSLPHLQNIIVVDTEAMFLYDDKRLISFAEVEKLGQQKKGNSDQFRQLIQETRPTDVAFIVFTSGTTGPAKPAMLTHKNFLAGCLYVLGEVFPDILTHEQSCVSHLSLAHVVEKGFGMYIPLFFDVTPHIGEGVEYLRETLYEVQPTIFYAVPRIYEKISAQIITNIRSSSWLKKVVYHWSEVFAEHYLQIKWSGKRVTLIWRCFRWLAFQLAFRPILYKAGLSRVKFAMSTGASLPPEVQKVWQMWGLDLVNFYGSTESGHIACQRLGFPKPGSVGSIASCNEVRFAEDGEVLFRGDGVFKGYWQDDKATIETFTQDGWLSTGETGYFTDDGNLVIVDRKKDIAITSGGKNIAPSYIESIIKGSPYISEAVVYAEGRKFTSALIEIDFQIVSEWARSNKILYTGYTSLALNTRVYELIGKEVARANEHLSRVEKVRKFRIIPKELDPETGDTTPTRKIMRKHMYDMFKDLVEEMYQEGEEGLDTASR